MSGAGGQQQGTGLAGELRRALLVLLAWKVQRSLSPVHPSLLMQLKEPPSPRPKCFWEHLALDSHCRFPVQTGW